MIKEAVKFLAKDTAVYGIAGAISKFIAVFTVPIVVRILTKEDYGILTTVISTATVFVGIITLGMDSSVARWFFDEDEDFEYRKKVASTGFFIQFGAMLLFLPTIFIFADTIGYYLFDKNEEITILWKWYLISVPASAFLLFSQNLFKWNFERNKFLVISIGSTVTTVALTLFFLIILKLGVLGALLAPILSMILFTIIGLILNRRLISFRSVGDIRLIKSMIMYGWPFAVVIMISAAIPSMDKLFLIRLVDLEVLGEYAVAVKISGLLLIIVGAFQISFGPFAYSIWKKESSPKLFSILSEYYLSMILFIGILMNIFAEFGISVFAGERYLNSRFIIPILTMAIGIQGLSQFSLLGITWSKKTTFNLLGSIFMFLCLLFFNYALTPKYLQLGAAFAILLTQILYVVFTFFVSQRYYYIPLNIGRLSMLVIITALTHLYLLMFDWALFHSILIGLGYLFIVITMWGWWAPLLKLLRK
jgi:O-antigen/teichoic acid export membrane protein